MFVLLPAALDSIADVGRWQPLAYLNAGSQMKTPAFIAPHWGQVKPFAMAPGSQFRPGPARHVVDVQAHLTPQQKLIADYWADGPSSEMPPGHWALLAGCVVERDQLGLDATVKLFFALANAILDASIATWERKLHHNDARPITTIRHLFRGQQVAAWGARSRRVADLRWHPLVRRQRGRPGPRPPMR